MFAAAFQACRKREQLGLCNICRGLERHDLGLTFGECSGLVDDQRVYLFKSLERFGILDQDTRLGASSRSHHDRHRRGQTECAGTGDDQHRHGCHQRVGHGRRRAYERPDDKGDNGNDDNGRHEVASDYIGDPLDGRAGALRLGYHLDDLGKHGLGADPIGPHDETARAIERSADNLVALAFLDRDRLARHHGLVNRTAPVENLPVHRHLFARSHAQAITFEHQIQRNLFVGLILP